MRAFSWRRYVVGSFLLAVNELAMRLPGTLAQRAVTVAIPDPFRVVGD